MRVLWIITSAALLVLGAELLVRGAAGLARRTGLSSFIIGLTIVGFGTTSPELLSSVTTAPRRQSDTAAANAPGSNVFNILGARQTITHAVQSLVIFQFTTRWFG